MPRLPVELIEQIAAANDIVDVIGGYFPLKRAGGVYKANCPFHVEKTPSFTVNPHRQTFKCFGCQAGGGIFQFVMMYENLEFLPAVRKLAERAGIRIVEQEMSAEDQARYSMRRRLLALHAEAADFFHYQLLKKPSAQTARAYLKGRGVDGEIAKTWKLGYAPEAWEAFATFAHEHGYADEEIVASGLVKLRDEGQPRGEFYDRFRGRVMFPICNDMGEVIAFSGRVLEADAKAAKYVNSPETPLFKKGAVLFGLHKSKRALIDKKSAIVCEGQLDLITAFENGVTNVIAPQGTAFTEQQAHLLKRYVEEVVLCFDADAAGEKAAEKSLVHLLGENLSVRVMEMPQGEDPDSLIRRNGATAFVELVKTAKDFFDYQLDHEMGKAEFQTARGRVAAVRKIAASVSLLSDPILRATIVGRVANRIEMAIEDFNKLTKQPERPKIVTEGVVQPDFEEIPIFISNLIYVAIRNREAREWLLEEPWTDILEDEPDAAILAKVLTAEFDPTNPASVNSFIASLDPSEQSIVTRVLDAGILVARKSTHNDAIFTRPDSDETFTSAKRKGSRSQMRSSANFERSDKVEGGLWHPIQTVRDCWRELECRRVRRRIEARKARLRTPDLAVDEIEKLQKEVLDLMTHLSNISRPLSPPL